MIVLDIASAWLLFVIGLELYTGFALIGIAGDEMLVDRRKHPRQYWFSLVIQSMIMVMYSVGRAIVLLS